MRLLTLRSIVAIKEIYAFLTNRAFTCRALNGDSRHSLAINCDLTVSCNCNDKFGFGHIGSLENQGLYEIFSGETANNFRKKLARGKLPIVNCYSCEELVLVDKASARKSVDNFKFPQSFIIENTVNCNLKCTCCDRERLCSLRKRKNLSLEEVKKISNELKNNKVKIIDYFNLGEPFLPNSIKDELDVIRKDNPGIEIFVSTNGIFVDSQNKIEAALLSDYIIFSIHGSDQASLQKYQKYGNFSKSYGNMKNLVTIRNRLNKTQPKIIWKYVLFRWNDSKKNIEEAIRLARDAGIDGICFRKTLAPIHGISYKSYLGIGYVNKMKKINDKMFIIVQ